MVPVYVKKIEQASCDRRIIFDLSRTKRIHSSFIGFLINTKQKIEKLGGYLGLNISPEIEKIFVEKGLVKFLSYNCIKKSA
jgi:anti-anti-sigma regulatory factor